MHPYHMNRQDRQIHDPGELQRLLQNGKYAAIAMCRNNEPYIVTLSYGYDPAGHVLYFHTARKGLKLDFLRDNPSVCATIVEDRGYQTGQCAHSYSSLVLWGNLTILEDLDEKKRALDTLFHQLETDPEPIRRRNIPSDRAYDACAWLRLDIRHISGKSGQ
ncbi:MAG TPA: pyridoxamine 5'-phosphate oxidase family protein [Selenomonadales bacterium]|nr:pyridoxamine 5'-phosphate oxidase family protein [Selenomonadales bacterium]